MLLPLGILLVLLQAVAAVPWLAALTWDWLSPRLAQMTWRQIALYALLGLTGIVAAGLLPVLFWNLVREPAGLELWGRFYAFILEGQLIADVFVIDFVVWLWLWPKGTVVALGAFREAIRPLTFWLIVAGVLLGMAVFALMPFFTLTDDYTMMRELDYNLIMVGAVLFGVLAASMSVSEEIEGRTAVTLMSKPVSRRQFLLGKFAGNLLAALVMTMICGWVFDWLLLFKRHQDPLSLGATPADQMQTPQELLTLLHNWRRRARRLIFSAASACGPSISAMSGPAWSWASVR